MTPLRANLLSGMALTATVGVLVAHGETVLAVLVAVFAWIMLWPLWHLSGRRVKPLVEPVEPPGDDSVVRVIQEAAHTNGGPSAPERGPERHG